MNKKIKNVETPSISSELKATKEETLRGLSKLYNLNLDIVEIYKITSALDYILSVSNDLDVSKISDHMLEIKEHQDKGVKELIQKIDKQVGREAQTGLKYEGTYPK